MPIPAEPIIFSKAPNSLSGPNDDVIIPRGSVKSDWEVELAIVIGERCHYVEEDQALSMILGYALCNDVSEREFQAERGGQWIKGKSAPTFGPLGPWLVTRDEIDDPQNLDMFPGRQWRALPDGQHQDHDLHGRPYRVLRLAVHGAGAGRHHHHGHAARCRHGHEAAAFPQGRRRDAAGHCRPRRTASKGRCRPEGHNNSRRGRE